MVVSIKGQKWLFSENYPPLLYAEDGAGLTLNMKTGSSEDAFRYHIQIKNETNRNITPKAVVLRLGIDSYMDHYPDWKEKLFPTTLRCEKTHFWGYFSTPDGMCAGIACASPIASWRHLYNQVTYGDTVHYGHRIYTTELCLLENGKQPRRHPKRKTILAGETLEYQIVLFPVDRTDDFPKRLFQVAGIPFLGLSSCTVFGKEKVSVYTEGYSDRDITIFDNGQKGVHKVVASNGRFTSEALFYRRNKWSYYLKNAAKQAVEKPQKASTHVESWLGLFSMVLKQKHFPSETERLRTQRAFEELFSLMYDRDAKLPAVYPNRIQNTAYMVSLIADLCEAGIGSREESLSIGKRLADFLLGKQGEDGAYYNKKNHYTCVCYIAKSILEFATLEKALSSDPEWEETYRKHYASVRRAIDDLVEREDRIGTEGEATFEDGMISCSALQIAMFALTLPEDQRAVYIQAAEKILDQHRCLEMNLIPDCRMRGSTIRFWEAQYDVVRYGNFITAAHGWTAWKNYALYYLYLLTGKEQYVHELYDSMGTCMQLAKKDLSWAFCVDPAVSMEVLEPDPEKPLYHDAYSYSAPASPAYRGKLVQKRFGECYIPMISGWYRTQKESPITGGYPSQILVMNGYREEVDNQGGCCDNDVHEHFKCLEETILGKLFVNCDPDHISVYGGQGTKRDGVLILSSEEDIETVYINSKEPIEFVFQNKHYPAAKGFVEIKH